MDRTIKTHCIIDREDFSWSEKEPYRSVLPQLEKDTVVTYEGRLLEFDLYATHRVIGVGVRFGITLEDCRIVSIAGEPILQPLPN